MLSTPKYSGEPTPQALASGLATLGRYGDDYMVHAAEGETVIPPEIFDANPKLKEALFRQMAMMGIKDPNRYVVGNSLNSINPITGQPEFFFKKIFKSIKKVFKKALPIIAPIVGNLIAPGIGGIIASGLATKMQGGSWGDVLKSAAMSYAGSALSSGLSGAFSSAPGATFMGGLTKGLTTPFTAASNLFSSGPANPLSQGIFGSSRALAGAGPLGKLTPQYNPNATAVADPSFGSMPELQTNNPPVNLSREEGLTGNLGEADLGYPGEFEAPGKIKPVDLAKDPFRSATGGSNPEGFDAVNRITTYFDPSVEAAATARYADLAEYQKGLSADYRAGSISPSLPDGANIPAEVLKKKSFEWLQANPVPGLLSRSAPLIAATGAAGLGIAALSGAFSEEEEEFKANPSKSAREIEAYEKWGQIPDKNSLEAQKLFGIWNMKPYVTRSQFEAQTGGRSSRPDWRFLPESNAMGVAMGGEVVGPGTGTSDSIPARLSDGEFVMTARAVQNAGGGNRDLGAARMYDMMRRFEGGVA